MYRIRRFGVVKTATLVAVMYLLITVIFIVPIVVLVAAFGGNNASGGAVAALILGLFAAVIYAVFGWIFTALACLLYNVAAGWVGGIEVQVEAVAPPLPPPAWGPTVTSPPTATPPTITPPPAPPAS